MRHGRDTILIESEDFMLFMSFMVKQGAVRVTMKRTKIRRESRAMAGARG